MCSGCWWKGVCRGTTGGDRLSTDARIITADGGDAIQPEEPVKLTKRDEAMIRNVQELFEEYADLAPKMQQRCVGSVCWKAKTWPICATMWPSTPALKYTDKQEVLEQNDPRRRIGFADQEAGEQKWRSCASKHEIQSKVRDQMDQNQRDYYLREQIKVINGKSWGRTTTPVRKPSSYAERISGAEA